MVFIWSFIIIMMLFPYKEFLSNLLFGEEKFSFHLMIGICTTACIAMSSIPCSLFEQRTKLDYLSLIILRMIIKVNYYFCCCSKSWSCRGIRSGIYNPIIFLYINITYSKELNLHLALMF